MTGNAAPLYRLQVVDTGVGIATNKLEGIFEPFVQADTSITRQFGGTGLGLAISRRFARLLGGDIVAHSSAGSGTTFVVSFDPGTLAGVTMLSQEEALNTRDAEAAVLGASWKFDPATRVLVVDDGEENRELVRLVLENAGLTIASAENGLEAVKLAMTARFDAVLMDIQMPVMDGYQASAHLRAAGLTLPIVALTADAMKGFEQKCLAAGCSHYLTKPVDIDALLELLGGLLNGARTTTSNQAERAVLPMSAAPADEITPLVSTLAQANPALHATIAKFVDGLPARFAQVQAAAAAGDLSAVAQFAHWLKGAAGTVGYSGFWQPASALEASALAAEREAINPLLDKLAALGARLQRPDSAAPATPPPTPTIALCVNPDSSVIHSRLPLGNPRMRATVERFLARLDERLGALEQAAAAGDTTGLAQFGSWLKGAGGSVGFDHFTAPATHLASGAEGAQAVALLSEIRGILARIELPNVKTMASNAGSLRQALP